MSLNLRDTRVLARLSSQSAHAAMPDGVRRVLDMAGPSGIAQTGAPLAVSSLLRLRLDQIDADAPDCPLLSARPDGLVLAECGSLADLQAADIALGVVEAECGWPEGAIAIVADIGHAPGFFLSHDRLRDGSARLAGLILDEEALARSIGLPVESGWRDAAPLLSARGRTVLLAADAGIPAFRSLPSDLSDPDHLTLFRKTARIDGFQGLVARTVDQVEALQAAQ